MKKYWIEYSDTWKNVPKAFRVHRETDSELFHNAVNFDPPAPHESFFTQEYDAKGRKTGR
jgi:hypothetical protein